MCLAHDGSIFLIAWLKGFGRICFPGGFRLKEYLLSIKKGLSRIWLWPAWCSGPQQFSPIGCKTRFLMNPSFAALKSVPTFSWPLWPLPALPWLRPYQHLPFLCEIEIDLDLMLSVSQLRSPRCLRMRQLLQPHQLLPHR